MLLGVGGHSGPGKQRRAYASPGAISDLFRPGSQSSQAEAFQGQFSFLRQALHTAYHLTSPRFTRNVVFSL